MKYRSEWKDTINRLGRFVDMENDYKTMDKPYMESEWWIMSELFKKGLVYRGYKICPYSNGCATPLSKFEANQNFKDVSDYSITVSFESAESSIPNKKEKFLVWTTTPWTLPSNLMLCVHPELRYDYVEVVQKGKKSQINIEENVVYVVCSSLRESIFGNSTVKVLKTVTGNDLVGKSYHPLFRYFYNDYHSKGAFQICADEYVQETSGTGIVHQAPAFGEDDYRVCLREGIVSKTDKPPCPIDDNGKFVEIVKEWKGQNIKESEDSIVAYLKDTNCLFIKKKEKHQYPFCWRSDTPLIYKACDCWWIKVGTDEIRSELQENNQNTNWVPQHVRDNRFGNWLGGATDWCVSRNRFWGTPLPIWVNEKDEEDVICISSVEELEKLANLEKGSITDLHRHHIDHITIPSQKHPGSVLKRVEYVMDCWFESGSMPYASNHYPFSGKEVKFANFIAEGLDQTRGWFYTLSVLGNHLFGRAPFDNVIVNGIVLAEDGTKMSKSKKNYPDPNIVFDKYGADALRLYLIDTPVVNAGDVKFSEDGMHEVVRRYHMMIKNVVSFYDQMISLYNQQNECKYTLNRLSDLGKDVTLLGKIFDFPT